MSVRQGFLVIGRDLDVEEWQRDVAAGERPRHYATDLARVTGMELVTASSVKPGLADRLAANLIGSPTSWAVARSVSRKAEPTEFVYATDEAIGIPLLLLSRRRKLRSGSLAMFVAAPERPKTRVWLGLLRAGGLLPTLIVVGAAETEERLASMLGEDAGQMLNTPVVVDDQFFSPGHRDQTETPLRPLVVSAGLEQRDYGRLAEAVAPLDIEVVVCAMSPDAAGGGTLPVQIPENMKFEQMTIRELRDLYRRADLFVLSTHQNKLAAGLTAVMESLACGTPVVASVGSRDLAELGEDGLVDIVEDPSPRALRSAIERALEARSDEFGSARMRLSADQLVARLASRFRDDDLLGSVDATGERTAVDVSVVVPVGRVEESLRVQLDALLAQTTDLEFEIVIAHNTPTPTDRRSLEAMLMAVNDDRVRVVEAPERRGAAHTRNAGAHAAHGRLLLFCDADDRVHPGWIDALVRGLEELDAVTGAIREIAPAGQESWRPPATPGALPQFLGRPYVLSGNLGVRTEAFRDVGGFDESLTRCEDIALGWSLQDRGRRIGFVPDAVLDYHHRSGFVPMLKQHFFYGIGMTEVLRSYELAGNQPKRSRMLKPNSQRHSRSIISYFRRGAIATGRAVGVIGGRSRR